MHKALAGLRRPAWVRVRGEERRRRLFGDGYRIVVCSARRSPKGSSAAVSGWFRAILYLSIYLSSKVVLSVFYLRAVVED